MCASVFLNLKFSLLNLDVYVENVTVFHLKFYLGTVVCCLVEYIVLSRVKFFGMV